MARPLPSLKLVGTPRFRPFRVVWMLEECRDALPPTLGFAYEHDPAAPQSDAARINHPMGKVPALLVRDSDGDHTIIESAAINTWLGDRLREHGNHLVPPPGTRIRAEYDSFVHFLMAEVDSSGLWIHRKLETLGIKKEFGAVRYALLPARLQFDRAMAGVRAQLEKQNGGGSEFYLVGHKFSAADILLVHCCDWAESIEVDKGGWFSKYKDDALFQEYLRRMRARPAYVRAREIQAESPWLD